MIPGRLDSLAEMLAVSMALTCAARLLHASNSQKYVATVHLQELLHKRIMGSVLPESSNQRKFLIKSLQCCSIIYKRSGEVQAYCS